MTHVQFRVIEDCRKIGIITGTYDTLPEAMKEFDRIEHGRVERIACERVCEK